jgi:hypothetical protein
MAEWLRFDVGDDVMYVHIMIGQLIELQPNSLEGTDEFCRELYPVLDKIHEICIDKNLKQVCKTDLTGIDMTKIKPIPLVRMVWNVYEYTKDRILLTGFQATGTDPFVKALVESVRGFLPPFMRNIINIQ